MNVALIYFHAGDSGGYPRDLRWLAGVLATRCENVWVIADNAIESDGLGDAVLLRSREFEKLQTAPDIAHSFGILLPRQLAFLRRMRASGSVVSTLSHAMPDHVARGRWKKVPYLRVASPLLLPRGSTVHLFDEAERPGVARYLPGVPAFVAPLGLFPAPSPTTPHEAVPRDYLLFFGRNDVHQKGIDLLLEGFAWAVRAGLDVPLVVAGAPHGNSEGAIAHLLDRLDLRRHVHLVGKVDDDGKWALLRGARALVFLSRWDGPPRPIREALAVGTPVIVSPGTNMGGVVTAAGAGCCVSFGADAIGRAMLDSTDSQIVARWRIGAERLSRSQQWDRVVDDYLAGYQLALAAKAASKKANA